ncbi:hypothetical protein WDU94_002140 [Cyamophila willieti]
MCRGTSKWVHQACLNRWIDEKQKGNAFRQVACPACNTKYLIVYPYRGGVLFRLVDQIDTAVYKLSPFIATGIVIGSLYWCAATYGAVTVMVVMGREEGLIAMKELDAPFLLLGLPVIPVVLILGNMVTWEDKVLRLILRSCDPNPSSGIDSLGTLGAPGPAAGGGAQLPPLTPTVSATRVLCTSLMLPTIAVLCGRLLFPSMRSSLQRTIVGGVTFIVIKGILNIYNKQQKYIMLKKRLVLDFTEAQRYASS